MKIIFPIKVNQDDPLSPDAGRYFVDINTKSVPKLLCNSRVTKFRVTQFHFNNGVDDFLHKAL